MKIHGLRHLCATEFLRSTGNIALTAALLGSGGSFSWGVRLSLRRRFSGLLFIDKPDFPWGARLSLSSTATASKDIDTHGIPIGYPWDAARIPLANRRRIARGPQKGKPRFELLFSTAPPDQCHGGTALSSPGYAAAIARPNDQKSPVLYQRSVHESRNHR